MSFETNIQLKLKTLPSKPGVYQYVDEKGTIIYIGKAKNLKKRVASYFTKTLVDGKTRLLVKRIADIHYIVVGSELDALLLENNLIKEYQPKYNIQLKDDKTFPWICIKNEPFPRVFSTRNPVKDGSIYYGPYPSVRTMNVLLELVKRLYAIRTCYLDLSEEKLKKGNYKVCLEYHLGNCKGPCERKQTRADYDNAIVEIHQILKGNSAEIIQLLKKSMWEEAQQQAFENAQLIKEKIELLENFRAKSTIVSPSIHEVDVITVEEDEHSAFVNYLVIYSGAIVHAYTSEIKKRMNETRAEIIQFVLPELRQRYNSQSKQVLVEEAQEIKFPDFQFIVPQKGEKKDLVALSKRNAHFYRLEKQKTEKIKDPEAHQNRILNQLQQDFRLSELPIHIECFDNSNIQGTNAVSACVVFKNGKPSKKEYRHFNIKTVEGPDDFASMREVVFRRYKRLLEESQPLPQLIVIDGGKGQLSAALNALEQLDLRGKVAIVGIAKKLEEIFFPGDSLPLYLDKRSESLKVIQHMRNEAHRFGITHHRNKRSKNAFQSELTGVKGLGEKTYVKLLQHFKSVKRIKEADFSEIEQLIGKSKATVLLPFLEV